MFPPIEFLLATTAIVITMVCYVNLLIKLKSPDEYSEFSDLVEDTYEGLPVQRRTALLEKIKEERIKEYLDRRKRKPEGSRET